MNTLVSTVIVLAAILITAAGVYLGFAIRNAKEGYEDDEGFHFGVPPHPTLEMKPDGKPGSLRQSSRIRMRRKPARPTLPRQVA
ncbi:MAG TPA: hypothetical protein VG936_07390 [Lacunisphaera sp.]|nr:hypothetical protein [Lacunisphaera sp.]